jgi:uncharacterized protein with von Willebrand factor type A (vWA) domain
MRSLTPKDDGFLKDKFTFSSYSIENDPFDIRNFNDLKQHSTKLLKSEEAGTKEYEQYPELQQDMYDALFKYEPELLEDWQIKKEFLLNRTIMETLMDTQRFKELRVMTNLDVVNSTVGTELLSEEAIKLVKDLKKEREALQEVVDADQAVQDANKAGNGKGKKGAKSPEFTLEEAKQKYEEALEKFKQMTNKTEFKNAVGKLALKVQDAVQETSELISNWGLESSGSFQRKSAHEKMELLNRLRNSSKLRRIAQMAGRFRKLFQLHKREKVKYGLEEYHSIKQGNTIERLIPSEMLKLLHPLTKPQFLIDLIEGKTLEYHISGKQKKGKGPVIICMDSSGSMDGVPEIWAKSVALVLLEIAREQKRDFYAIHFSSGYRGHDLHTNEFLKDEPFEIEKLIDMAEYFESGGTEFEPPLNLSREKIGNDRIYQKADIIFVTDGESVVTDAWLTEFRRWKRDNKVNVYSVLIDSYSNSATTLKQFSDRIDKLSNLKETQEDIALDLFLDI